MEYLALNTRGADIHPRYHAAHRELLIRVNTTMVNKHFFKTLIIFTLIIVFGLIGMLVVSYFDTSNSNADSVNTKTEVAK